MNILRLKAVIGGFIDNEGFIVDRSVFMGNILVLMMSALLHSCTKPNALPENENHPLTEKMSGFQVPADSVEAPVTIVIDESRLRRTRVSKPVIMASNENARRAAPPKIVKAGTPRINIPGTDGYSLPMVVPARDSMVMVGTLENTLAKDPHVRDQNPFGFSILGKQQGLKHGDIICMIESRRGELWMGTNGGGVSKYDGKSFTHYTEEIGLSSNLVWAIHEDKAGNIWFGTYGGGVTKYDGQHFKHYTTSQGLSHNTVRAITEDREGNLWFGTEGGGVNKYDGTSFTHFTKNQGLGSNMIRAIKQDHKGNLWFGTMGGGVTKYDGTGFSSFSTLEGLGDTSVISIMEDAKGNMWFGTDYQGVCKYDGKYFSQYTQEQGLSADRIWSIMQDQEGMLWFGTDGGGASRFDGTTFAHYGESEGLSNNRVWQILEDSSGNLWFCTDGSGICKFNGRLFRHFTQKEGLFDINVRSIMEDADGDILFATDAGVSNYDGKQFIHYTNDEEFEKSRVRVLEEDKDENLWIGTFGGGVMKFDGTTLTHFTTRDGLSGMVIRAILEDRHGNMWFGTFDGGLCRYDGSIFTQYTVQQGLSSNNILSMIEDASGNIWIGTNGGGVNKFDGQHFTHYTVRQGLSNNYVWAISQDRSGNLWFGTWGGGVDKYDGTTVMHLTEREGLSNNYVFSMLEDKSGNMWFGTRFGLSCLLKGPAPMQADHQIVWQDHPGNDIKGHWNFRNYTYLDGFYGVGVNGGKTLFEDKKGQIWIGSNDRLTVHLPAKITETPPPEIHMTDIELFNEKIAWTEIFNKNQPRIILGNGVIISNYKFDKLSKWYFLPENLRLAYDNNFLTFNFIGITMNQPHMVKYQYKLQGADKNWSAITDRTSATYGYLPAGHYTFLVKAMNAEGFWSDESAYSFEIRPPWWLNWWMYVLYVITAISALILIVRWNGNLLRKRAEKLAQEVEKATVLIRKQKESVEAEKQRAEDALVELKETQAQLVQSEKMASLGTLTTGVAHEINNPLNYILGGYTGLVDYFVDSGRQNEKTTALLSAIKAGIDRATSIVRGLSQFNRNKEGMHERCDLRIVIGNCLSISHSQFKNRIEVIERYPEDAAIKGNIGDLHQLFMCILSNAADAITGNGNVTINTQKDAKFVTVEISDTGCGISDENLPRIADPFFTTKDPGKGTGLGLSIAYKIVQEHQGKMTFKSEVGIGTTVTIELPLWHK